MNHLMEPKRTTVEFAIVIVDAGSDQQLIWTVGSIAEDALTFNGSVLQILGPVVFVAFSGVIGAQFSPRKNEFVAHLQNKYRILVRVVHGQTSGLVGNFGGSTRLSYTAALDNIGQILSQLTALSPGAAVEHVVQPGAQPEVRENPRTPVS